MVRLAREKVDARRGAPDNGADRFTDRPAECKHEEQRQRTQKSTPVHGRWTARGATYAAARANGTSGNAATTWLDERTFRETRHAPEWRPWW